MADFPNTLYPDLKRSADQIRDPLSLDYSKSGTPRGRRLQPAGKRTIVLAFSLLTAAERTTLLNHFNAHRTATFNFSWPDGSGGPYLCIYGMEDGIDFVKSAPLRYDCVVTLLEQ